MSNHPARILPSLFVAFVLGGCGDDTTSSPSSEDAGPHSHEASDAAAADSGKSKPDPKDDEKKDAGRPTKSDAATSGGGSDAGQPLSDDEQAVKLRFRAQLGDAAFACGSTYTDQGSSKVTITPRDLRLFVQDVALVNEAGDEVPVRLDTREPWQTADVALLDFEDSSGECAGNTETNSEITGVVPKGKYSALRFSHGVPEKLNHADPKTFPAPLKTPGMSWNWLLGLRFVRFEVATQFATEALDVDAGADPGSYSLHVGSTGCAGNQNAGTIKCAKPNRSRIELKNYDLAQSEIILDVAPLLKSDDLSQTVECHSGTANCESPFQALGVNYVNGQPGDAQSVFRLE